MSRQKRLAVAALAIGTGGALLAPAVLAGPDASATVRFGTDDAGSSFAPITAHDASGNAKFNLVPKTVAIAEGGSVTYDIFVRFGIHQPAVYEAGSTPDDIQIQAFPFVNDTDGRLALGPPVSGSPGTAAWTTPGGTFDEPGRYLILCNFAPHFAAFDMYGWVQVK